MSEGPDMVREGSDGVGREARPVAGEETRELLSDDEVRERIMADPRVKDRVDEIVKDINSGSRSVRGITDAELRELLGDQR